MKAAFVCIALLGTTGCFQLDGFVWNPIHCDVVDKNSDDCKVDHVCSTCDEPYDFTRVGIPATSVTQVTVPVSGGQTVDTYFVESSGERSNDVVVYAHGNFGSVEHYLNRVALLFNMGVNVFAIDYRGFGKSSTADEPDEPTFTDDVHKTRSALDPILAASHPNANIIDYGYSAGALAAVEIAKTSAPCGLILEAPWPSVQSFTDDSTFADIPGSMIANGTWDNIAKMPDVHAPLLQLQGLVDTTVRAELGHRVFDAANEPKTLHEVPGAEHGNGGNDVPTVLGDEYPALVEGFLDGLTCTTPAP